MGDWYTGSGMRESKRTEAEIRFNNAKTDEVISNFIEYIESSLKLYNSTCEEGFELTFEDVIKFLMKTKDKQ